MVFGLYGVIADGEKKPPPPMQTFGQSIYYCGRMTHPSSFNFLLQTDRQWAVGGLELIAGSNYS